MRIPGIPYHQGRNNYSDRDGMHYGIAIHNTSNTASDEGEASYADHRTDGTSSHFYVDGDSVIQSLDTNAKAGHAGSANGNENAIAFEITGTDDKSRDWWLSNVAWRQLGYVIAYMLKNDPDFAGFQVRRASVAEMVSNPKVRALYGHDDMRRAWGGTTHTDPGPNFPWDRLFEAINQALGSGTPVTPTSSTTKGPEMLLARVVNTQGVYLINGRGNAWNVNESQRDALKSAGIPFLDGTIDQITFDALRDWDKPESAATVTPTPEQWAALTAAIGDKVGSAVLAGLQSPEGQAALVQAANTDS